MTVFATRLGLRGRWLLFSLFLGLGVLTLGSPRTFAQEYGDATTPAAQSPEKDKQEADETERYRKSPVVVALGGKLGLNPDEAATAFEVLNFVVLAGLLGWGMAIVLPKAIRDRNEEIRKHITDAERATTDAQGRLAAVEKRLSKLDEEIAVMRVHAEQEAKREEQKFRATLEEEKQRLLAAAEQEISAASAHARQMLKQQAAELAIEQAARKLVVTAETDRLLVQSFAQRLTDEKKGQN